MAGEEIGLGRTLLLCALTAIIGGFMVRQQGLQVLLRGQEALRHGTLPVAEMFDGFCIVAAGAMLITPGFVTDTLGFLLLVPPVRAGLRRYLARHMDVRTDIRDSEYRSSGPDIIEGSYERLDENDMNGKP